MKTKKIKYYDNFGRVIPGPNRKGLGMAYTPVSIATNTLSVDVPDSMGFETHEAIKRINKNVGGNTADFVTDRLGYVTTGELFNALAAEQIDAVALAIYNIEAYSEGMIIGDQTGIGKGRQAAAIIRYAVEQGMKPIFLTEKPNLFSDIYRDLIAIGSGHLVPFIVNGKESKTDVKDEEGNILHQALDAKRQEEIFKSGRVPANCNFVMATYSQFNSAEKKPLKPNFLLEIAKGSILIFDEAHNASGSSQTGEFLKNVVRASKGVLFLSATFAKRPDNMAIYALKTAISEANMDDDALTESITRGGVALQEILASQMVKEAQMLRRERTYAGIPVNYITLTEFAKQHQSISDKITSIIQAIITFQKVHIEKAVDELDSIAAAMNANVEARKGTSNAGVDNLPYFSKVFNVINQMLFSIKAEAVAFRAIARLKQGKKPVIAFASTMETFLEDLGVEAGGQVNADFSLVLEKGLDSVLKITERGANGEPTYRMLIPREISVECAADYQRIRNAIRQVSTGISISPIDIIKQRITEAGYTVAEVTGRKTELQINPKTLVGIVMPRKKINTNDAFRQFNNNEVDVLMINQAGSTGASAHAVPTKKVSADKVKERVMIVLQPELDINKEVQKRGRINRTGQILKPEYDYISSAIPAEQRLMMMLQRKLKSLDANTTSNQKNSSALLSVPDFLNRIGDAVVVDYLIENPEINKKIDDPLKLLSSKGDGEKVGEPEAKEDAASRVSGRIAILSVAEQQKFYDEIISRYNDQVDYLKQIGEYDLEVETLDLRTKTIRKDVVIVGKGGRSLFGTNSFIELVEANVLKKPYTKAEVEKIIYDYIGKQGTPGHIQDAISEDFSNYTAMKLKSDIENVNKDFDEAIKRIPTERKIQAIKDSTEKKAAIEQRVIDLEAARLKEIASVENKSNNNFAYLNNMLTYFYVGRGINFPELSFDEGNILTPGICLGVVIDKKKSNPYAPSAIKFRFALTDSKKYITLVASGKQGNELNNIISASIRINSDESDKILTNWTSLCSGSNVNRKNRYIITGNILQAFKDFKGNLVSYTTESGDVKKGILMPENYQPNAKKENYVDVPIIQALSTIKNLAEGRDINTSNAISIRKNYDNTYTILAPKSRSKGGEIYLDKDLLQIVTGNNFNMVSGYMKAVLAANKIEEFVKILQNKFNASVQLHHSAIDTSKFDSSYAPKEIMLKLHKPVKRAPAPKVVETGDDELFLLELEAEAIEVELQLLDFRNLNG